MLAGGGAAVQRKLQPGKFRKCLATGGRPKATKCARKSLVVKEKSLVVRKLIVVRTPR